LIAMIRALREPAAPTAVLIYRHEEALDDEPPIPEASDRDLPGLATCTKGVSGYRIAPVSTPERRCIGGPE
jgi:hypothetical protein